MKRVMETISNHALRHRSTGFGFALSDQIAFLDPERWDRVTGDAPLFLGRDYLGALEASRPENLSPRYALISRGAKPVAAVVAQVVNGEGRRWMKEGTGGPAKKVAARLKVRLLVCGNLLSWGCHGAAFAPGALWPAVAEALYRIQCADRLLGKIDLVLVKDLADPEAASAEALRP